MPRARHRAASELSEEEKLKRYFRAADAAWLQRYPKVEEPTHLSKWLDSEDCELKIANLVMCGFTKDAFVDSLSSPEEVICLTGILPRTHLIKAVRFAALGRNASSQNNTIDGLLCSKDTSSDKVLHQVKLTGDLSFLEPSRGISTSGLYLTSIYDYCRSKAAILLSREQWRSAHPTAPLQNTKKAAYEEARVSQACTKYCKAGLALAMMNSFPALLRVANKYVDKPGTFRVYQSDIKIDLDAEVRAIWTTMDPRHAGFLFVKNFWGFEAFVEKVSRKKKRIVCSSATNAVEDLDLLLEK